MDTQPLPLKLWITRDIQTWWLHTTIIYSQQYESQGRIVQCSMCSGDAWGLALPGWDDSTTCTHSKLQAEGLKVRENSCQDHDRGMRKRESREYKTSSDLYSDLVHYDIHLQATEQRTPRPRPQSRGKNTLQPQEATARRPAGNMKNSSDFSSKKPLIKPEG